MNTKHAMRLGALAAAALATTVNAGPVHVDLAPANQVVNVGDIVEVDLIVMTSDGLAQGFDALDAIIGWNTTYLNLLTFDNSGAGASFFATGFFADPDGINASVSDGDALFTALATPGSPVSAPPAPGSLIVTTFQFQALAETIGTDVVLIPDMGTFGETRVLLNGVEITGSILGPATITIVPAPGAMFLLGIAGLATRPRRRN